MPTRDEALDAAADVLVASNAAIAQMTPREQAEAAWTPTSTSSVDEIEDRIRAKRGMAPLDRSHTGTAAQRSA